MPPLAQWFDRRNEKYRTRVQFFRSLPLSSTILFLTFVFLTFCTLGVLTLIADNRELPLWYSVMLVVSTGLFAVGYAWVSTRLHWMLIFPIMACQFSFYPLTAHLLGPFPLHKGEVPSFLAHRLAWGSTLAIFTLIGSYSLVITLFSREGHRYFRVHTEMQLASEIHRALVPRIQLTVGAFEIYGTSLPSGAVGGDLVDAVVGEGKWIAYVADVSGHGVSSGVLMGMFKSATRMSMRTVESADGMLAEVNEVFHTLRSPGAFATFAAISFSEARGLEVLVAGHLPVLHCNGTSVGEIDTPGLPVGVFAGSRFHVVPVCIGTGDVLAIVTDGLTEVFDKRGEELGSEYIKRTLLRECGRPLDEIASSLMGEAQRWGERSDDQSILLVRKLA